MPRRGAATAGVLAAALLAASFAAAAPPFTLRSPAFRPGGTIPRVYTCDGTQRVVPLRWGRPPRGTRSFALRVDDPDAPGGTFVHRLAWDIAPSARGLAGPAPREGTTSAGRVGWVGPCPPSGVHRYVFRLYALRSSLPLRSGAGASAFAGALRGRVLGTAVLVGRYGR